ncbi:TIGR02594 family protein [Trabulsiella odontotermitis]|uniref:TIGR02594 family protein n=1 Tax=Trabulsiella odontotermitis TaxID=379893 RepID=UPI003ACDFEE5
MPDGISKPQEVTSAQRGTQAVPTGTSDKGYPQANVGISTEQAPWMKIALEQAKLWAGKDETEISRSVNYHKEVGIKLPSLVGDNYAWCASYVNYCLINSNPRYRKSNEPTLALSFSTDSINFKKINSPQYGAIACFKRKKGGHACFVVAKSDQTPGNIIVLGGNQSNSINFVDRSLRGLVGFYVPTTYSMLAEYDLVSEELVTGNADDFNASLNIDTTTDGSES